MRVPSYSSSAVDTIPTVAPAAPAPEPRFHQRHVETTDTVRKELLDGLAKEQAHISPKFLYDELGSSLFTAITLLDEYYPTRCENEIFAKHSADIVAHAGPVHTLIDLGAGDCAKAERLLAHVRPAQYVPIDISVDYLKAAVKRIADHYPDLEISALGMDFFNDLSLPAEVHAERRAFFYPGSSIGNLPPEQAADLLANIRRQCADGALIIGVDLVKAREILEPAYDDAVGVTAAFNLNMLRHVNKILGSDFNLAQWQHLACFNEARSRMEMHLRARVATTVRWPGGERSFKEGERIHTEDSYKYRPHAFKAMLSRAGFGQIRYWTDEREWFAVFCARA
ncbi:L-histidine N(alpha)-methyltransferase [Bordetella genomosp. 11]|uniref:L-histidine N(Alpha)-methyltransferase n=1 Tax=Bordetella genomosp. 11 TaxID=1416808 RepID=A0A261UK90_9BORD|nr:L-histidine N(alpha)-methyltransferase [Bordetella genomosp. 11]OZI61323.1 L-histidine N(alpha)-methyltransferase [Bordetella genomosp. 11]